MSPPGEGSDWPGRDIVSFFPGALIAFNHIIVFGFFTGILHMAVKSTRDSFSEENVRPAAVSGQFYPADPNTLRSTVEGYLEHPAALSSPARLVIAPHAGYPFSGPVAGRVFAEIDTGVSTVILIGPSHRAMLSGVSIPEVSHYETPLGKVALDEVLIAQLRRNPLVTSEYRAHETEHCLEVQIPFLQVKLGDFRIVPILTGRAQPQEIAEWISPHIGSDVLVVISSDLSHFHSNDEAKQIDKRSVQTIESLDAEGFIEGCGETGIRTALLLAKRHSYRPLTLDTRTSFDTAPEYGSSNRVVGYTSVAFVANDESLSESTSEQEKQEPEMSIGSREQEFLLNLARESLRACVTGSDKDIPEHVPEIAQEKCGCFVTLRKSGELRGCIGYLEGTKPLYQAIIENAENAACRDNRFFPVSIDELNDITIEISVLTPPEPLSFDHPDELVAALRPGEDGIILKQGFRQSTYLPQVWEQLPGRVQFLESLALKGGMARDEWKTAEVQRYQALHFSESQVV